MLGLDDLTDTVFGGSPLGLGIAAVAVVGVLAAPRLKPVAKSAIIGYLSLTERAREWAAEAVEQVQDLYAEAKYEYEAGLSEEPGPNAKAADQPA
jgi:hypothetical protein